MMHGLDPASKGGMITFVWEKVCFWILFGKPIYGNGRGKTTSAINRVVCVNMTCCKEMSSLLSNIC